MPIRAELQQLEKCIDNALRKNDFKPLERFLQMENYEDITLKCSKQFFSKLDNLMCKELNKKDIQNTSTILNSLGKYGKNISIFGETGLLVMIKQGLVKKITWFEKTKDIILSHKKEKDEAMTNLIEDFFDVLMTVHDINKEGKIEVLENFILRICALVVDMRIHMCIQQEAIKKLNVMLDGMPRDAKKIISKREMLSLMIDMGKRILDAGDYDFQVAITEALCRMTSEKQRRELASQWFPMEFIATAFKKIKDSDFETDCRKFLNHVNGMLGDKRLVFTFPCLSVFLDRYELQIPSDEKLDDFWIDFNLGSQSISFYISGDDEDHQWETVNVSNDEVEKYSVEVKDAKKILTLFLKTTMNVGNKKGDRLVFYFDHLLDIIDVTKQIYGTNKYKEFTKKQAISVAKTAVHIIFDESGSQILVPESQSSPAKIENSFKVDEKPKEQFSENQKDMIHNANQQDLSNTHFQMITPIKRKMSEASMVIPGTDKLTLKTLLADTSTPQTRKVKPPLKMVNSAEPTSIYKVKEKEVKNTTSLSSSVEGRNSQSYQSDFPKSQPVIAAEVIEMVESDENSNMLGKQNSNGDVDIISDSQPVGKIDKTLFPTVLDNSYESNVLLKWTCWTPVKNIKISSKESADTSPEETFNQDFLSERVTDKSSPSSISENIALEKNTVSENLNQILDFNQKRKGDVEYSKKKKTEVETCETNRRQSLNSISLDQKNIEENKENDWHIESETFKSVLLNRTIEKSLIYTKKLVLAKELNNDCCDKTISSGINAKSNRRPMKGMTSESRSCDLETNRKKEKTKGKHFTDAAESLIDQINKRYNQKDDLNFSRKFRDSLNERRNSNKPGLLIRKEKILNKNSRQLKRTTSVKMTSECALNDVYNFQLNGADDPTIRLGTEEFQTTIKESSIANSKKSLGLRSHDGNEASLKEKDKKTRTNHRKHLFSDTDTDYRGDDSKTDISWLKESNKKPKPQLVDYSRNKKVKKPQNMRSSLSGEVKLPKSKKAQNTDLKVDQRITETTRPQRPRRAGLVKKNYKDFSNSESESEEESLPGVLSKEKLQVQVTNMRNKSKTTKQLKKGQHAISAETQEEISKEGKKSSKVKDYIREKRLDSSPIPLSGSPASIEIMRCSQKTIEREFPQDYIASQKFASPFPQNSTPERTESVNSSVHGITGNSFYAANVRIESKCLMQSPENIDENLMFTNKHFSSPLFLPKINSVIMDKFDDSGKDLEIPYQNIQDYDIPMDLSSYDSEKQFSGSELKKIHENFILCSQKEPLSPSQFSLSSSKREKLYDISIDILHQKGSNIHTNLKRLCTFDNLSNSDEMELEEEEERRQNLLPPKLIKTDSDHVTYKVSGSISTLSANEFSFPGETWETQSSDVDIMCQKLNKEFKKKIQNQCQKMDYFNKLSLKSAEQHLTSINDHIYEYRMKQLNKFQFNMMEELENFEKDSQSLKNLEREFSEFWKKTCQKLGAYKKNEQKRVHLLKTSFEKNVSHNIEYEENIFTSEMYLMKEEMKRLQEKLLKEMQEEELHNVRRGLMSLFTSNERKF